MNDTNKTRTINTNFYGDRAFDILDSVSGQLSDGMWENSRGYDKYWTNFRVVRLDDNRVVFHVNKDSYTRYCGRYLDNPFARMSDTEFLAWYAGKLKAVIVCEAKDHNWKKGWWKRNNTTNTSCYLDRKLDITVADIYGVYDELLGRKNRTDAEFGMRIWGKKADAETIAKRADLQSEKEQAAKDYKEHVAMIEAEQKKAIEKFDAEKRAAHDRYIKVLNDLEAKYNAVYSR